MKNKSEFWGLFANVVAILMLLCFIILGLNRIGVYDLPENIENFLGTSDDTESVVGNEAAVYDSLKFEDGSEVYTKAEISYKNAMALMKEVSPRINYSHGISVNHYFGDISKNERFDVVRNDGLFDIMISDAAGNKVKHITELSDNVKVETFSVTGSLYAAEFPKGRFSVSDECGFVLTVEEFLKENPQLDSASFMVRETENDVLIDVAFETEAFSKKQSLNYTVSLEYGIVVDYKCYENSKLVYEMKTVSLEK